MKLLSIVPKISDEMNTNGSSQKKEILLLILVFCANNILLLLNYNGIYWDDWVSFQHSYQTVNKISEQLQPGWRGYLTLVLMQIGNGVLPYRIVLFVNSLAITLLLYLTIRNSRHLKSINAFYFCLIFMTVPVASGMIATSISVFLVPVFFFFAAFWLLSHYLYAKKEDISRLARPLILLFFFLSFNTNSLLVLYAVVALYILMVKYRQWPGGFVRRLITFSWSYADFLILPFIYISYKMIFLKPHGLYQGYNTITLEGIIESGHWIKLSFTHTLYYLLHDSWQLNLTLLKKHTPVLLAEVLVIYSIIKSKLYVTINIRNNYTIYFMGGCLFFILAIFPYVVVHKFPLLYSWDSRYQVLTPLGISLIVYSAINIAVKTTRARQSIVAILIWCIVLIFTIQNTKNYYLFLKDYFYQVSIAENFASNKTIKKQSTFIVKSNVGPEFAYNRVPSFYEWTGWLRKIFHEETRFMVSQESLENVKGNMSVQEHRQYNFKNWKRRRTWLVTIDYNKFLSSRAKITLFFNYLFDYEQFKRRCKKLTKIKVKLSKLQI